MNRLLTLLALFAVACGGSGNAPRNASVGLDVTFETPHYRASAAVVTDATQFAPTSLRLMVCDDFALTEVVTAFCRFEDHDYHFAETLKIPEGKLTGSLAFSDIPPARKQVLVVQGIANDTITYQGFVSMATIEPRGAYEEKVTLKQTYYPPLPPPVTPVITEPAGATMAVPPTQTTVVIKGTREIDTILRVSTSGDPFRIGNPQYLSGNQATGYYKEHADGDSLVWEITLQIPNPSAPAARAGQAVPYPIKFAAARESDPNNYSKDATVLIKACGTDLPDC
jgi:hypothetical protein